MILINEHIPIINLLLMFLIVITSTIIPIIFVLIDHKKHQKSTKWFLYSILAYIILPFIIGRFFRGMTFMLFDIKSIIGYSLILASYTIIFEETARIIMMKVFMKKELTFYNTLYFGLGFGLLEVYHKYGSNISTDLYYGFMNNIGKLDNLIISGNSIPGLNNTITELCNTPTINYLYILINTVFWILIQVLLSIWVYYGIKNKQIIYIITAIIIHLIIIILSTLFINNLFIQVVITICTLIVLLIVFLFKKMYKLEEKTSI